MSAYALPNLFPPVGKVDVNFCPWESFDHVTTAEKTEHTPVIVTKLHHEPSSIRVTSARVDPVKLIQSLTTNRRQSEIPLLRRKCRRGQLMRQNHYRFPTTRTISPQEDAMQFILSIFRHSGRHYSITRTLTQIRQFQVALSKEVGRHGMSDNQIPEYCSSSQNDCYQSSVPELPAIHSDDCKQLGFSLLQDQLLSYSPSLEQWFQKVLDDHVLNALDGSPAFSDFLYEPVVEPSKVVVGEELVLDQSMMLFHSKLHAIEESCMENDAEEELVATEEADKIE